MKKYKLLKAHIAIPLEDEVIIALFIPGQKAFITRSPKEFHYTDPHVKIHLSGKTNGVDQFNIRCEAKVVKID